MKENKNVNEDILNIVSIDKSKYKIYFNNNKLNEQMLKNDTHGNTYILIIENEKKKIDINSDILDNKNYC